MSTLEVLVNAYHSGVGSVIGNEIDTYDLSNNIAYIHLGNDGLGLTEFVRYQDIGVNQEGATDRGAKLRPRKIQLVINLLATSEATYWAKRQELLKVFRPDSYPIILKFTTSVGTYYLDCFVEGGLTFSSSDKQGWVGHRATVQLIAPDPLFYTTPGGNVTIGPNVTTGYTYNGTYATKPYITITGPITAPNITNVGGDDNTYATNSGKQQSLAIVFDSGYTLASGSTITLDTRYGKMTAHENPANVSVLYAIESYSSLTDFVIYPSQANTNYLRLSGSGTSGATQINMVFENKYIGI